MVNNYVLHIRLIISEKLFVDLYIFTSTLNNSLWKAIWEKK